MRRNFIIAIVALVSLPFSDAALAGEKTKSSNTVQQGLGTLTQFEASSFIKAHPIQAKEPPRKLRNGHMDTEYDVLDDSGKKRSIEIEHQGNVIKNIGIIWYNDRGTTAPLEWTPQMHDFAVALVGAFVPKKADAEKVVKYLESRRNTRVPEGVGNLRATPIGPIGVKAGTTGGDLILDLTPLH